MIDPGLWASTPYGNETALRDYFGMQAFYDRVLADEIARTRGVTVRLYPLGDGGGAPWLFAHQQQLVEFARALGIEGPPDLSSFNLRDEQDHASFHFLNASYYRTLRSVAGIA